jgi:hypothetical protein
MLDNGTHENDRIVEDDIPHERLASSISHLENSGVSVLKDLRKEITGEDESVGISDSEKTPYQTLESVLHSSPKRIHDLTSEIGKEVERIREALFKSKN